jgi:hypothetical protein
MIMKKGTANASDVMPWTRDCSELGKVLTVLGMTSHVVLKLVNGPQALEDGMRDTLMVRGITARHSPMSNTNRKKKLELDALNCLGEGLQV